MLLVPELGLYVVCDGMGGHAGGEVASAKACEVVRRYVEENRHVVENWDDSALARDQLIRLIQTAVQRASQEIFTLASSGQGQPGMGTTLTMVIVTDKVGAMGHVGDSRLYMQRAGKLYQLSEDHTYINEMVKRGIAKLDELKNGPYANVITRAVGIQPNVHADTLLFDLLVGDTLLLCSDGLSKHVENDTEIGRVLDNDHLDSIPQQLIDLANARGGTDNITALVVRSEREAGETIPDSRTTEITLKLDVLREVALFRHLEMGELCKILNAVRLQECRPGDVIVREGAPGDSLYAILEGKFSVLRNGATIASLGPGSHFGEMALFNNRPRSATVQAHGPAQLLVMERGRFNDLVRKEPDLGVKLLWAAAQVLSLRLDETSVQLYSRIASDALKGPFD